MTFYRPHDRVFAPISGPSMTKQNHKAECDISNILKKFEKTGLLTHTSQFQGRYEDLPSDNDFQSSLHQIFAAREAFGSLPAKLRKRFNNDPSEFLGFVANPDNKDELVSLGLAKPSRPADPATIAEPIDPTSPNRLAAG